MDRALARKFYDLRAFPVLFLGLTILAACARHDQDEVRVLLSRWFSLGDTVYFSSQQSCTAAVFEIRSEQVKSALRLETEMTRALRTLEKTGVLTLSIEGKSPDQIFIDVTNADRSLGMGVQEAAILSRDCMDEATEGAFHAALSSVTSLFVWHEEEASLVIFDRQQKRVLLVSGAGG
ncbi:MAG: hypothetical protein GY945_07015 [Rhodobacteraceae bacterium]|nr:hypothetical protein [Paracoccaceae bacterium]